MDLNTATQIAIDSVMHTFNQTFAPEKLHAAIRGACSEFARKTNCSVATANVSLSAGTATFDPTVAITDFQIDWFVRARIGFSPVGSAPWQTVLREYQDSVPKGKPTVVAFDTPSSAMVSPQPDAAYTMVVTYRQPSVAFTLGATSNPTLNIPEEWLYGGILRYGVMGWLTYGLPGHPEAEVALNKFDKIIAEAQNAFAGVGTGTVDRNSQK